MPLHAIVLVDENDQVANRIEAHYPLSFQINDTVFLVRTEEITEQVAVRLGMKGDDRIDDALGAVLKLNGAYAGHAPRTIWEWLEMKLESFATKEDIQKLATTAREDNQKQATTTRVDIQKLVTQMAEMESSLLRWYIITVITIVLLVAFR